MGWGILLALLSSNLSRILYHLVGDTERLGRFWQVGIVFLIIISIAFLGAHILPRYLIADSQCRENFKKTHSANVFSITVYMILLHTVIIAWLVALTSDAINIGHLIADTAVFGVLSIVCLVALGDIKEKLEIENELKEKGSA